MPARISKTTEAAAPAAPEVVEAPQAKEPSGLTYGDACKLISRLLVANPNGAELSASIRVIIDGTGLPAQFDAVDATEAA